METLQPGSLIKLKEKIFKVTNYIGVVLRVNGERLKVIWFFPNYFTKKYDTSIHCVEKLSSEEKK